MQLRVWLCDGWFVFSVCVTLVIVIFFAVPTFFGFQNFVQWGAMYDNRWCTVIQYDKNPNEFPDAQSETIVPGSMRERVYSGPTHNRQSCLAQAKTYCGTQASAGWIVKWVEPEFQKVRYTEDIDVCTASLPSLDYWFFHADL